MDLADVIKSRYSVRKYKNQDIPQDKLDAILKLAQLAPSAHNSQNYKIIIVKDQSKKDRLAEVTKMPFVAQAPVVMVGISPDPSSEYWSVDMAIIFDHISLAAVDSGLGTCWVGSVKDEAKIREIVGAPEGTKARIVMPIGYPDHKPFPKKRKNFDQVFFIERYK